MANTNQSKKRARQAETRRRQNAGKKSLLRTSIKKVLKAISAGKEEDAAKALKIAEPIVDKMAGKKIIHRNKAARIKSRLVRKIKLTSAQ